jgi:hypothetical protein
MRVRKQTIAQKWKQTALQSVIGSKITKSCAHQVAAFIERYRPALEALGREQAR